ncbi:2-amino-4-hydroxy-6-hydroxymethyldihydropteridine diphosphokinase [Paenibacillus sp. N4]|uniref:2-amino-4-hydroxy-6- hydroxymethyldihydropteridine diphosphokinase n=1 Tax=Paenibacillus vietnamensis TaxID=2590547 RepID=UPI001CD13803|nr:2-amino-4-hydroxy-6-hydroxymethyldihydropteridine diphosphokinase [Paenibacillus vietnamensis]MCA0758363.1 2-amino-4-hydroxy-6-hydroxymethyldihydropteridine diphosphokinase [Paenibacillus vietnamensis]
MDELYPREPVWPEAYVALGSNIGNREQLLKDAIDRLDGSPGIQVCRVSGIYETDPVGYTEQPPFLNMVIAVRSEHSPVGLLHRLFEIEKQLGRVRDIRFGPRTIDLDLLLYDNVLMDQEELTLPHPRMMERSFVLVPLQDVIDAAHPLHEKVKKASKAALQDGKEGIALWKTINWRSASEPFES